MPSCYPPRPPLSGGRADYSDERRATALRYLNGERDQLADLPADALLTLAVGLLICNDVGFIKKADLPAALADPSVVQAATNLLHQAGF